MRILVAEDDRASLKILEGVLPKWGYTVEAVADGRDALRCLTQKDAPKLALLDWVMPEMDGIEVCRRVRLYPMPAPPYIIILTQKDTKDDVIAGLEAGADDYLTKPFNPGELRARLDVGRRMVILQSELAGRVAELQDALFHIRELQEALPICSHCHRIRDDKEVWQRLEKYILDHSGITLSHGLCPDCLKKYYPEYSDDEEGEAPSQDD